MSEVTIKAEHVNPFLKATIETFSTMADLKVVPGKIKLKEESDPSYDVSGIIGLGGGAKGTVALSFPRVTALGVVRAFMGEKVISTTKMVDAIGELANIVAGAAKRDLTQYKIQISLPTVILGEKHAINCPVDAINLMVPFDSPAGKFFLVLCFKSML
jgi:chemotaxis protein CheX